MTLRAMPLRDGWAGRAPRTLLALAVVGGLFATQGARAAAPSGLIVIPHPKAEPGLSYFRLQARPGSSTSAGAIELRNRTSASLRAVIAPVDGETLSTLGSAYGPPGSHPHGSTAWLQLGSRTVALGPGASVSVPVSVRVPASARPGDYLSGISIEALDQRSSSTPRKGVSIASVSRYAIGVEVSLAGPRVSLIQFTGARVVRQPAGLSFVLLARNSGNVILKGVHGSVRVARAGRVVVSQRIEPGTFVSGTRIAYPLTAFGETPPQGTRYQVSARLRYPGGIARLDTTVTFGHRQAVVQEQYRARPHAGGGTAWWKIAAVAAAMLYGLGTTFLLLRRRGRPNPADPDGQAPGVPLQPDQEKQPV